MTDLLYDRRRRGVEAREQYHEAALRADQLNRESPALTAGGAGENLRAIAGSIGEMEQLEGDTYAVREAEAEGAMQDVNQAANVAASDAFQGGQGIASNYAAAAEARRPNRFPTASDWGNYYKTGILPGQAGNPVGGVGGAGNYFDELGNIGEWAGGAESAIAGGALRQFQGQTLANFGRRYNFRDMMRRIGADRVGDLERWAQLGVDSAQHQDKMQYQAVRDAMEDARQQRRDWMDEQRFGLDLVRADREERRLGRAEDRDQDRSDLEWARLDEEGRRNDAIGKREERRLTLDEKRYGEESQDRKSRQSLADDLMRRGHSIEAVNRYVAGDTSMVDQEVEDGTAKSGTTGTGRSTAKAYTDKDGAYLSRQVAGMGLGDADKNAWFEAGVPTEKGQAAITHRNRNGYKYRGDDETALFDALRFADPDAVADAAIQRAGIPLTPSPAISDKDRMKNLEVSPRHGASAWTQPSPAALQKFRDNYNQELDKVPASATLAERQALATRNAWTPDMGPVTVKAQRDYDAARASYMARLKAGAEARPESKGASPAVDLVPSNPFSDMIYNPTTEQVDAEIAAKFGTPMQRPWRDKATGKSTRESRREETPWVLDENGQWVRDKRF